jgi:hypothetical protein
MKNGRAKKMGWKDPPIRDKHETIHFAPDAIQAFAPDKATNPAF